MVFLLAILITIQGPARADCGDAQACKNAALEAAARKDYEAFHDLAWSAVQKGSRNDPDLMYLLARAQSLSGRPGDALVMLTRLAARGVTTDAGINPDFQRVRALPGWKAYADAEAGRTSAGAATAVAPGTTASPATAPHLSPRATPPPERASPGAVADSNEEGAIHFSASPFVPAGLAYDAVSRRFIAGDRDARKLIVIDEPSHHAANLAGAHSAGFGEITALEIDRHEGDLWVASVDGSSSTLHKLQLVSGRVIYSIDPSADAGAVRFVDVAVTPRSSVLALDGTGGRLFLSRRKSRRFDVVVRLPENEVVSVAPASNGIAYVSSAAGLFRVDLNARSASPLKVRRRLDVEGLTRIRVYRGSIVGVQRTSEGRARVVRVRLNAAGTLARSLTVLAGDISPASEVSASIAGDVLYYLSDTEGNPSVRRVRLK